MSDTNVFLIKPLVISTTSAVLNHYIPGAAYDLPFKNEYIGSEYVSFISTFIAEEIISFFKRYGLDQWLSYNQSTLLASLVEIAVLFFIELLLVLYSTQNNLVNISLLWMGGQAALSVMIGNWLNDKIISPSLETVF